MAFDVGRDELSFDQYDFETRRDTPDLATMTTEALMDRLQRTKKYREGVGGLAPLLQGKRPSKEGFIGAGIQTLLGILGGGIPTIMGRGLMTGATNLEVNKIEKMLAGRRGVGPAASGINWNQPGPSSLAAALVSPGAGGQTPQGRIVERVPQFGPGDGSHSPQRSAPVRGFHPDEDLR